MEITSEKLIEILKENFEIITLEDDINVQFEVMSASYDNNFDVELLASNGPHCMSNLSLYVDASNYDEKFADVDKYEVPDMGIIIEIQNGEELEDFNEINIWKNLFFNK